jgi:hypothetical protein
MLKREKYHKKYIDDVCSEISQTSYWRNLLFNSNDNVKLLIDLNTYDFIPEYIQEAFREYNLKYYVSKTKECPEVFDPDLVIFRFEAFEYP